MVMSYAEIEAWKNSTKNDATPFDVMMIRAMSNAYISMQDEARNIDCKNPYEDE